MEDNLEKIFIFIVEIDKLKTVYRQTYILGEDRPENDAEHSWHMAMMVPLLSRYSNEPIDEGKTIKLCLAHDLVEIYAGDTYCYDPKAGEDKAERENAAAKKLFSQLDEPLRSEISSLWTEFEDGKTPEAKFAAAMDRLQPLLLNLERNGRSWIQHGVCFSQAEKRVSRIKDGSEEIFRSIYKKLEDARDHGWFKV
jgi:putative hydrolase of HD superfamily